MNIKHSGWELFYECWDCGFLTQHTVTRKLCPECGAWKNTTTLDGWRRVRMRQEWRAWMPWTARWVKFDV